VIRAWFGLKGRAKYEVHNMIKTLRITTIIAAMLAVGFFAFPAVFGFRGNEEIEQFLNSPGAIEEFNKAKGAKPSKTGSQTSPLVKQAVSFGLYLNPPPRKAVSRPKPPPPVASKQAPIPEPARQSVKFKLVGTSYYESRPEMSLAYIDEPGKGLHWVKQGSNVAHLVIEQVKDGSIVVKDRESTVTLVAERPPKRSLIKGENTSKSTLALPGASASITSITSNVPVQVSTREAATVVPPRAVPPRASRRPPEMSDAEQDAVLADFISELKAQQREAGAGAEEKAALEEAIAGLKAMRVDAEEAKRLDRLGKEMRQVQGVPDRAGSSKVGSSKRPQLPLPPPTRRPSSLKKPPR
jgi:hypothetical protein